MFPYIMMVGACLTISDKDCRSESLQEILQYQVYDDQAQGRRPSTLKCISSISRRR